MIPPGATVISIVLGLFSVIAGFMWRRAGASWLRASDSALTVDPAIPGIQGSTSP